MMFLNCQQQSITNFEPATVLVNRTSSGGANLAVESTDSARARVTDFRVPPIQFRLEPFVFSDDEMYLVVFYNQNIKCFRIRSEVGSIIITNNSNWRYDMVKQYYGQALCK